MLRSLGVSAVSFVLLCVTSLVGSCSRLSDVPIEDHWIWMYVPRPTLPGDGFLRLRKVVKAYEATNAVDNEVLSTLLEAANSCGWSGHPYQRRLYPTKEMISTTLVSRNADAEIDYQALIALKRDLAVYLDNIEKKGETRRVRKLAEAMIQLGFQIARREEDLIIATLRLALWDSGFRALVRIGVISHAQETEILTELNQDLDGIKRRDRNRLYRLQGN